MGCILDCCSLKWRECQKVVTACVLRALHSFPLHQPISKGSQPKWGQEGCDSLVRVNVCITAATVGLWGFFCTQCDINGLCPKGQPCPPTATSASKLYWDVVQVWLPAKGTVLFSPCPLCLSLFNCSSFTEFVELEDGTNQFAVIMEEWSSFHKSMGWLVA